MRWEGVFLHVQQVQNILNAPVVEERPATTADTAAQVKAAITLRPPATKTAAVGALPKAAPPAPAPAPEASAAIPAAPATTQQAAVQTPAAVIAPAPAVAQKCRVWTASYGGQRSVIVKSIIDSVANFTVLDVNEGQESREAEAFISAYAKGGSVAGEFANQNKALEKAFELCPEG